MTGRTVAMTAAALLALAGCGGGGGGTDAGPTADTGGGPSVTLPRLTNGTTAMPLREPANYACLGTRTEPSREGTPISYNFDLRGFGSGDAVRNARVWFWPDNIVRETCDAADGCIEFMTSNDDMATGAVMGPPGAWYAYHVFMRDGATMATRYVDSIQINEEAPAAAGGRVEGNAVSQSTLNLIPAAYGFNRLPGTAIVAGEVQDCDGDPVRGGLVRLYNGDDLSEYVSMPDVNDAVHIQYFDGNENPDGSTEFSQVDGLYAGANIPGPATGFRDVVAVAWGVVEDGADPVIIGCETVATYGNGVSIVNLGPLRADYPAGHPCNTPPGS